MAFGYQNHEMDWIQRLSTIGYHEIELLGEGLSSWVFKANLCSAVSVGPVSHVLKVGKQKDKIQDLESYFWKISKFRSKHCPAVFGWHVLDGHPVLLMDYVNGRRLSDLAGQGVLDIELIDEITAQLQEAITELHEGGLQHGDLHPENILIDQRGRVQLIDFGHFGGVSDSIEGAPAYMAAESWREGQLIAGSDWFSLGLIHEDLLDWNHFGVRTVLELKRRSISKLDCESLWFHPDPDQRGALPTLISTDHRRERLAGLVQLTQSGWDPICGTQVHSPKLKKALRSIVGILPILFTSLCLASLPVSQPSYPERSDSSAEIEVRTMKWFKVSVNGGPSLYSPIRFSVLKPGVQDIRWEGPEGPGQMHLVLKAGEKKVLTDRHFVKSPLNRSKFSLNEKPLPFRAR